MNEPDSTPPQPQPAPVSPAPANTPSHALPPVLKKLPVVHLIFCGLLLIFVAMAYLPSRESPSVGYEKEKAGLQSRIEREEAKEKPDNDNIKKWKESIKDLDTDIKAADKEWQTGGAESRGKWIGFNMMAASFIAMAWLIFSVVRHLLAPLMKMLNSFFGPEFAGIMSPVVLLAVGYVLAKSVLAMLDANRPEAKSSGFLVTCVQFVQHIIRPASTAIVDFGELVLFRSYLITLSFMLLLIYAVLRKFLPTR